MWCRTPRSGPHVARTRSPRGPRARRPARRSRRTRPRPGSVHVPASGTRSRARSTRPCTPSADLAGSPGGHTQTRRPPPSGAGTVRSSARSTDHPGLAARTAPDRRPATPRAGSLRISRETAGDGLPAAGPDTSARYRRWTTPLLSRHPPGVRERPDRRTARDHPAAPVRPRAAAPLRPDPGRRVLVLTTVRRSWRWAAVAIVAGALVGTMLSWFLGDVLDVLGVRPPGRPVLDGCGVRTARGRGRRTRPRWPGTAGPGADRGGRRAAGPPRPGVRRTGGEPGRRALPHDRRRPGAVAPGARTATPPRSSRRCGRQPVRTGRPAGRGGRTCSRRHGDGAHHRGRWPRLAHRGVALAEASSGSCTARTWPDDEDVTVPFTVSHAVVALATRRLPVPVAAVAIGSMAPDTVLFARPFLPPYEDAH
ncbi:hypothetical protein Pfo_031664, partial [Paulownia fortunei]